MIGDYVNNEYCNPFDELSQNFFMKLEHCGRYLYALDTISSEDVVADIACATGYGSALLAENAKYVIGCDINDKYLNIAKQKYSKSNLGFIKTDINQPLSLFQYKVSTIVSFETIEHTTKPFKVLQKFYNLLPIGGRLILSFPNADCEMTDEKGKSFDPFHLSIIKFDNMVEQLTKIGFTIDKILGQSFINKIIAQVLKMEQDLNFSCDELYNYTKKNIINQSRVLAYPNENDIKDSYSFIFDVRKL